MTKTYWKADFDTGALLRSSDGVTYTAVTGIVRWRFGFMWDGETQKTVAAIWAKVQDAVSTQIVDAQGAGSFVLSSGYIPTREFRTSKFDDIQLLWNGAVVGTIAPATGWPAGGVDWSSQFADSMFKEPI